MQPESVRQRAEQNASDSHMKEVLKRRELDRFFWRSTSPVDVLRVAGLQRRDLKMVRKDSSIGADFSCNRRMIVLELARILTLAIGASD